MAEKYIVLNKMYNGDYLKKGNLGHEVINMYKDDHGNNYIYLQSTGEFDKKRSGKIKAILLVRTIKGLSTLEVVGKAVGLTEVYGKENQLDYIKQNDIRYGRVLLNEIFARDKQHEIFITFKADKVLKPKKPIYIKWGNSTESIALSSSEYKVICVELNNFRDKTYIDHKEGFEEDSALDSLIDDDTLWGDEVQAVKAISGNFTPSMFDVCGIKYNELAYSHSLYYFLKTNYDFAKAFVSDFLGLKHNLTPNYKVYREKDNIDLYIEDGNLVIIIENKIKSAINGRKKEDDKINQLSTYWANTEIELKERNDGKKYDINGYVLMPNYNHINTKNYDKRYNKVFYNRLYDLMCNQPAYKSDIFFKLFTDSLIPHTKEFNNELYDEMTRLFAERIN